MIALVLMSLAQAATELEVPAEVGVETVVRVTDTEGHSRAGETVRVLYRPGLSGEQELAIGITDGRGRVRWTPEVPGIAQLRAGDERIALSVARSTAPTATWVLLGLLSLAGVVPLLWGLLGERSR